MIQKAFLTWAATSQIDCHYFGSSPLHSQAIWPVRLIEKKIRRDSYCLTLVKLLSVRSCNFSVKFRQVFKKRGGFELVSVQTYLTNRWDELLSRTIEKIIEQNYWAIAKQHYRPENRSISWKYVIQSSFTQNTKYPKSFRTAPKKPV